MEPDTDHILQTPPDSPQEVLSLGRTGQADVRLLPIMEV